MLPTPPPAPKRFCSNEGKLLFQSKPSFLGVEYLATSKKKVNEFKHFHNPVILDGLAVRQLMMRAVAAICAHSGFESKLLLSSYHNVKHFEGIIAEYTELLICCRKSKIFSSQW